VLSLAISTSFLSYSYFFIGLIDKYGKFARYGPAAAENARLATGTVRNVVLVYIDMKGIGRKALLRTMGKEYVKARVGS
jgi:Senescence-associated protein